MNFVPDLQSPSSTESNFHLVSANYNKLSDQIRRLTPQGLQCCVFCGGTNCKYENPDNWTSDSLAIQGIYSHWITDNIIAMARPSTVIIAKRNVIKQFESLGIRSIFNLQTPREHASCGQPLEDSGFSYDPNIFMENNIFYYNFAWKDYGEATIPNLINMVKVLAFATSQGRVAVHCHAGLGRTGVLIACYLVYSLRANANDAIRYVRYKRPGSVQTRGQILCVRLFAQYILPQLVTYYIKENIIRDKYMTNFTLAKFLKKQTVMLHGYEERNFKYLPKIVHVICERILKLCGCRTEEFPFCNQSYTKNFLTEKLFGILPRLQSMNSLNLLADRTISTLPSPVRRDDETDDAISELSTLNEDDLNEAMLLENKCFQELETQKNLKKMSSVDSYKTPEPNEIVDSFLANFSELNSEEQTEILQIENDVNSSSIGWSKIQTQTKLPIMTTLLFDWLEGLKMPVIQSEYLEYIVVFYKQPEVCLKKFKIEDAYVIEYILYFISKIKPLSDEERKIIIKRFVASLSQRCLVVKEKVVPAGKEFQKLREGTLNCTMEFISQIYEVIKNHHIISSNLNFVENENRTDSLDEEFHL